MSRTMYGRRISNLVVRPAAIKPSTKVSAGSPDDERWKVLKTARDALEEKSLPTTVENLGSEAGLTRGMILNFFKKWPGRKHALKVVESRRGPRK